MILDFVSQLQGQQLAFKYIPAKAQNHIVFDLFVLASLWQMHFNDFRLMIDVNFG